MTKEKGTIPNVPKNVTVSGVQVPVNVTGPANKPVFKTEPADPRKPIKTSPYSELMPADDEWVKKYGGSDISIVAFNVAKILKLIKPDDLKEKSSDTDKDTDEGEDKD